MQPHKDFVTNSREKHPKTSRLLLHRINIWPNLTKIKLKYAKYFVTGDDLDYSSKSPVTNITIDSEFHDFLFVMLQLLCGTESNKLEN